MTQWDKLDQDSRGDWLRDEVTQAARAHIAFMLERDRWKLERDSERASVDELRFTAGRVRALRELFEDLFGEGNESTEETET